MDETEPEEIRSRPDESGFVEKATAIICCTQTGQTARLVAKYRPVQPIVAVTPEPQTVRPLMLAWGIRPFRRIHVNRYMVGAAMEVASKAGIIAPGVSVVVVSGAIAAKQTDFLRVVDFRLQDPETCRVRQSPRCNS